MFLRWIGYCLQTKELNWWVQAGDVQSSCRWSNHCRREGLIWDGKDLAVLCDAWNNTIWFLDRKSASVFMLLLPETCAEGNLNWRWASIKKSVCSNFSLQVLLFNAVTTAMLSQLATNYPPFQLWPHVMAAINKAISDGPVGQVLAGPVPECKSVLKFLWHAHMSN